MLTWGGREDIYRSQNLITSRLINQEGIQHLSAGPDKNKQVTPYAIIRNYKKLIPATK